MPDKDKISELDELIWQDLMENGEAYEDIFDVHLLGEELECVHLTDFARKRLKAKISQLLLELIDEVIGHDLEYRETDDMSLSSWTNEDYKAFGRNELRNDIRQRAKELLNKEN